MGEEYSSTGPDEGQFDKTRWRRGSGTCRAGCLVPRKLWLSYVGSIGGRSMRSPEDAEDLVQGFFEHLIGSRRLKLARPRADAADGSPTLPGIFLP